MALTHQTITALVALSGGPATGYAWQGVGGTSRFDAARRRGARAFLVAAQGGVCPDCGTEVTEETGEFCHVVSRGLAARTSDEGKGWTAGNLFLGHRVCPATDGQARGNKAQQARGPVVLPEHLTAPEVVPSPEDWPTAPELRRMGQTA